MSETSKEVDNRLVQELKAGNIEAFDKIVELYQRKIYALSFNITRNQMDAEDVAQEVLLSIYKKIDTFQGKAALDRVQQFSVDQIHPGGPPHPGRLD